MHFDLSRSRVHGSTDCFDKLGCSGMVRLAEVPGVSQRSFILLFDRLNVEVCKCPYPETRVLWLHHSR